MADWAVPVITSRYDTVVLPGLKDRDIDALTLGYGTITNPPTGAFKFVRASNKFQEYNGATWDDKVIAAAGGGTGNYSYAVGDILWASAGSTLSKLNIGTALYLLRVNAAGNAPEYVNPNIFEPALGNPTVTGYLLSSTNAGVRSWIASGTPSAHQLDGAVHTVSGLTTGHFLKATSATTFGFAAHGLGYADVGAAPAAGSSSITTLGTITTGVWNAGAVTSSGEIKVNAYNTAFVLGSNASYLYKIYKSSAGYLYTYFDSLDDDANSAVYFRMRTNGTPVNAMILSSAGAATFAAGVSATTLTLTQDSPYISLNDTAGETFKLYSGHPGDVHTFWLRNAANADIFTVTATGAATFAAGITAKGMLVLEKQGAGYANMLKFTAPSETGSYWEIGQIASNLQFSYGNTPLSILQLRTDGAATFASTITTNASLVISADSSVYDFITFTDTRVGHTRSWRMGPGTGTADTFGIYDATGATIALKLAQATGNATFAGLITTNGFGTHTFSAGGTGANLIKIRNTTNGAGNYAGLGIGNDIDADILDIISLASSFTTSGPNFANGSNVSVSGVGGLSLTASSASGDVRIYSRNALAVTFGAAQATNFTGNFAIATNKFTVAAATGNTLIAGTLGVTGAITGNVTGNCSGSSGSCTGLAASATVLANARTIGGVSFNGSANITVASATGAFAVTGITTLSDDVKIAATKKLYLDGGGDTYIHEVSANVIEIVYGGVTVLRIGGSGLGLQVYDTGAWRDVIKVSHDDIAAGYWAFGFNG